MPNVKIYVANASMLEFGARLTAALPAIRELLCNKLSVEPAACQLAVIPVLGPTDQPQLSLELHLLQKPDRTPDMLRNLGNDLRTIATEASGQDVPVRISSLDPATYLTIR